jgi:hypothetical protein
LEELVKIFSTETKPTSNDMLISNSLKAETNANSQLKSNLQSEQSVNVAAPASTIAQPSSSTPIKST